MNPVTPLLLSAVGFGGKSAENGAGPAQHQAGPELIEGGKREGTETCLLCRSERRGATVSGGAERGKPVCFLINSLF